jgi:hypothetical protein
MPERWRWLSTAAAMACKIDCRRRRQVRSEAVAPHGAAVYADHSAVSYKPVALPMGSGVLHNRSAHTKPSVPLQHRG